MEKSPDWTIRDALPADLPAIVECAVAAFTTFEVFGPSWWSDAGVLPALLAALPPAPGLAARGAARGGVAGTGSGYSRVAVDPADGSLLGHAQWNLGRMRLAGRQVEAAWLAPLSVHPRAQKRGLGGALMRDGIGLLRSGGIELLAILGHDAYYPRFGLLTGCMGRQGLGIPLPAPLTEDPAGWLLRPLACGDEVVLRELWTGLCGGSDGAVDPGPGLLPWVSKTKGVVSCVLEREGRLRGHARFDARHGVGADAGLLRFLAADREAAAILLGRVVGWTGWTGERLFLPLPSASPAARELLGADCLPVHEWWTAGMAMALQEGGTTGELLRRIVAREEPPLFLEWSTLFDF